MKISGDKLNGDYEISIQELKRDAGYSKETATPINIGEEITATANTSLEYWYNCTIPETAKYEVTIHNVNVGSRLEARGTCENSSLFFAAVNDETSQVRTFFAKENDKVFVEVKSDHIANGKYIVIIKKIVD